MYWLSLADSNDQPRANYMIVAVRQDQPTPVQQSTFGGVKTSYR